MLVCFSLIPKLTAKKVWGLADHTEFPGANSGLHHVFIKIGGPVWAPVCRTMDVQREQRKQEVVSILKAAGNDL